MEKNSDANKPSESILSSTNNILFTCNGYSEKSFCRVSINTHPVANNNGQASIHWDEEGKKNRNTNAIYVPWIEFENNKISISLLIRRFSRGAGKTKGGRFGLWNMTSVEFGFIEFSAQLCNVARKVSFDITAPASCSRQCAKKRLINAM